MTPYRSISLKDRFYCITPCINVAQFILNPDFQNLLCTSFIWCLNSTSNFRTIGLQMQILSYAAHCRNQQLNPLSL